ncbi:alpha/beta hydrolase family protein [Chloroflexota bacterium]
MIKEFVVLEVEGIPIAGWLYLPESTGRYPAVCLCHGIPSGKPPEPDDGGYPALAERLCREGFAVMIFNFRGTGDSGGNLDILGWTRDLQAVIDYFRESPHMEENNLFLAGFSGGAAVSVYVAARDMRISGVIPCACPAEFTLLTRTDNPQAVIDHFRDIGAIRDRDFPPSAEKWFENFRKVQPIDFIAEITPRPLLLIHGSNDETVAVSHAHRLFNQAGEPKEMVTVAGAGHRLRRDESVIEAMIRWLKENSCSRS